MTNKVVHLLISAMTSIFAINDFQGCLHLCITTVAFEITGFTERLLMAVVFSFSDFVMRACEACCINRPYSDVCL